ncbi:MAG TPA: hypothetical protein VGL61_18410 [Kofleriaceae bacterium]|jgi:hypothetical protein
MRGVVLVLVLGLGGCGAPSAPPAPIGPPASFEPTPAPDDVVVATVNGTPIYGACLQGQAARGADKQTALQQCIDFELLAQAGSAFATNPDVALATRTAMVSRLVGSAYEDGFTQPAQFGGNWNMFVGRNLFHVRHEAYRGSSYVRVEVPATATPAQDAAAHQLADRIAAALAPERGLLGPQLLALAQGVAGATPLKHEDVPPYRKGASIDPAYAEALFAIPEVGRTSSAVRTKWGWDVVAWTEDVPATSPSDDEVARALMPDVKREFFPIWVERIRKQLGIRTQLVTANLPKLEAVQ